jgi:hypothetical protein
MDCIGASSDIDGTRCVGTLAMVDGLYEDFGAVGGTRLGRYTQV